MQLAGKILLVVIPSALFVGLAILLFGGPRAFFSHPP